MGKQSTIAGAICAGGDSDFRQATTSTAMAPATIVCLIM